MREHTSIIQITRIGMSTRARRRTSISRRSGIRVSSVMRGHARRSKRITKPSIIRIYLITSKSNM